MRIPINKPAGKAAPVKKPIIGATGKAGAALPAATKAPAPGPQSYKPARGTTRVSNTSNLPYQITTGNTDRKTLNIGPSKVRMGPNSVLTPSLRPPKRNIIQDLMILLRGGTPQVEAPSGVLGVRG